MRSFLLAAIFAIIAPIAVAQTTPIYSYPPQNDTVFLTLALEDWVQTGTARAEIAVDAALPGADAGKARGEVLNAVKTLAQGADWRFTRFDQDQDSSGLEHWRAALQARLPESQLGGLSDRAKQASRPGMQIDARTIDFSPTLAETEAAKSRLRSDMYKKINEALAELNQAEPDRKYRIMRIDFNASPIAPLPQQRLTAAIRPGTAGAEASDPTVQLSQRVEVRANVTFAALAPHE